MYAVETDAKTMLKRVRVAPRAVCSGATVAVSYRSVQYGVVVCCDVGVRKARAGEFHKTTAARAATLRTRLNCVKMKQSGKVAVSTHGDYYYFLFF